MKTLIPFLLFVIIATFSCTKESADSGASPVSTSIIYPDSGFYGMNILKFPDTSFLLNTKNYSMAAGLPSTASLSLILTNLSNADSISGQKPVWNTADNSGWQVDNYNSSAGTQKFTATRYGSIDLQIIFLSFGLHGSCRVDFYENSTVITRSRYLKWK